VVYSGAGKLAPEPVNRMDAIVGSARKSTVAATVVTNAKTRVNFMRGSFFKISKIVTA
jgi:hypothetical protein